MVVDGPEKAPAVAAEVVPADVASAGAMPEESAPAGAQDDGLPGLSDVVVSSPDVPSSERATPTDTEVPSPIRAHPGACSVPANPATTASQETGSQPGSAAAPPPPSATEGEACLAKSVPVPAAAAAGVALDTQGELCPVGVDDLTGGLHPSEVTEVLSEREAAKLSQLSKLDDGYRMLHGNRHSEAVWARAGCKGVALSSIILDVTHSEPYVLGIMAFLQRQTAMLHASLHGLRTQWTNNMCIALLKVQGWPSAALRMRPLQVLKSTSIVSLNLGDADFTPLQMLHLINQLQRDRKVMQVIHGGMLCELS